MADEKTVKASKYRADVKRAREEGRTEGLDQGRKEILDWLEHAYIKDSGRPDRGSPKAEAILEMAQTAATHFKKLRKRHG